MIHKVSLLPNFIDLIMTSFVIGDTFFYFLCIFLVVGLFCLIFINSILLVTLLFVCVCVFLSFSFWQRKALCVLGIHYDQIKIVEFRNYTKNSET